VNSTGDGEPIELPAGFGWHHWVERWERMQERYLVRRAERFATMIYLVRELLLVREGDLALEVRALRVLCLGCGPGSLMEPLLEAIPQAEVWGIDSNPTMLLLARERLARFGMSPSAGARVHLVQADLRDPSWAEGIPVPVDAVLSATALHWLLPEPLAALYRQIAGLLRPGGLLLNADHVGSGYVPLQRAWERHREVMREREGHDSADDWDGWWEAYARALGREQGPQESIDGWEGGIEEGLPLAWHLDRLRECGFRWVDCFWRCDNDAIYGGIVDKERKR
jgi:SAM-dependent methyltransferase